MKYISYLFTKWFGDTAFIKIITRNNAILSIGKESFESRVNTFQEAEVLSAKGL